MPGGTIQAAATNEPKRVIANLRSNFRKRFGPWAVITGASSGIGAEFAYQLSSVGIAVILVARRKEVLDDLAATLSEQNAVATKVIAADLSTEEGRQAVITETQDLDVGLLVNSAGTALVGSFFRDPAEDHAKLISLDITAVTTLSHSFGRRLADRGSGGIIFVSSTISTLKPWFASYASSKSYVANFALLLREELKPKGVTVMTVIPGPTKTDLEDRMAQDFDFKKTGMSVMPVDRIVAKSLRSFARGAATITPGIKNNALFHASGALPTRLRVKVSGVISKRGMNPDLFKYA